MSTKLKTICKQYNRLKAEMEELAVILAETQSSLKIVSPETAPVHKAFKKLSKDDQAIICQPRAIMFRAVNADKAISRRQVGDKAQIVVDEDSELEIEGVSVHASPLMGERVPPARGHVSKSLSSPGLTIEEIVPKSTPVDPVGGPSIREERTLTSPRQKWLVL